MVRVAKLARVARVARLARLDKVVRVARVARVDGLGIVSNTPLFLTTSRITVISTSK